LVTISNGFYDKMYLMRNDFGNWLKLEREKRDLTQADLARLASVNRAVINKIETGTNPTPETLRSIGKGLKIPLENIFRAAGILPEVSKSSSQKDDLLYLYDQLKKEGQEDLVTYARFLLEKQERA